MAFKTFAPGVLTSSDVNTFLMRQAVITCTSSTRPASPAEGMTIYETDTNQHAVYTGTAWKYLGMSILQIQRGTDSTNRTTTSTSAVDAGISVSITPLNADSNILLIWAFQAAINVTTTDQYLVAQITTSGNSSLAGNSFFGRSTGSLMDAQQTRFAWTAASDTSARTYKGRYYSLFGGTVEIGNSTTDGQLFAIEVSA